MSKTIKNNNLSTSNIIYSSPKKTLMVNDRTFENVTKHLVAPLKKILNNTILGKETDLKSLRQSFSKSNESNQSLRNFLYFKKSNGNENAFKELVEEIKDPADKRTKLFKFKS